MGSAWVRWALAITLVTVSVGVAAGSSQVTAQAQASTILAGPGAFQTTYLTPVAGWLPQEEMRFHNLDLVRHDVVARDAYGSDDQPWCDRFQTGACPAFWSPLIGFQEEAHVQGLETLAPGAYTFYCTQHPWMEGTLVIPVQPDTADHDHPEVNV